MQNAMAILFCAFIIIKAAVISATNYDLAVLDSVVIPRSDVLIGFKGRAKGRKQQIVIDDKQYPLHHKPKVRDDPIRLEVTDMKCDNDTRTGYFQALLKLKSFKENVPVVEDAGGESCHIRAEVPTASNQVILHLNIASDKFEPCGIRDCSADGIGEFLCLRLRFPAIKNLRLAEDPVLTLQCKTKDAVVRHTNVLQMPVINKPLYKASETVAAGGVEAKLNTQVNLFRRLSGARTFGQVMRSGETILLGEELLLKATLDPTQGWHFSRLATVALRRGPDSVILLDENGCVNPEMQPICPIGQIELAPLVQTLLMRAATFRDMESEDTLNLSVQMVACIRREDCRRSCALRHRRDVIDDLSTATWNSTSELSFRVLAPDSMIRNLKNFMLTNNGNTGVTTILIAALTFSAIISLFALAHSYRKANTRSTF